MRIIVSLFMLVLSVSIGYSEILGFKDGDWLNSTAPLALGCSVSVQVGRKVSLITRKAKAVFFYKYTRKSKKDCVSEIAGLKAEADAAEMVLDMSLLESGNPTGLAILSSKARFKLDEAKLKCDLVDRNLKNAEDFLVIILGEVQAKNISGQITQATNNYPLEFLQEGIDYAYLSSCPR